ncbi:DDE_3 domain-containing protein [Trichonephila clavipes]|nr:DDE_3 domain-containing protein [Trichonephila clavipes]
MNDNLRPHRALLVDEFLESEDIRRMAWPATFLYLKLIEPALDALERAITTRKPLSENHPRNKNSVAKRVGPIATQEPIDCLISNYPMPIVHMPTDYSDKIASLSHVSCPCIALGLPQSTMITHLVKRWQSVESNLARFEKL